MKTIRKRKAVSPVFSTILLILIVTIAMSALFSYIVGYSSSFQQGRGSARLEMIEIEDVWFKPQTQTKDEQIIISIYNYGDLNVTIVNAYMNSLQISMEQLRVVVPPGTHIDLSTNDTTWNPYVRYHFRLVSERGSNFDADFVSPATL
jgi:flagellin-like protein